MSAWTRPDRHHFRRPLTALLALLLLAAALPARALPDGWRLRLAAGLSGEWSGAASLDTALGFPRKVTRQASARLMWQKSEGPLTFRIHSVLSGEDGDAVAWRAAVAPVLPAPLPTTLLDLTTTLQSGPTTRVTNRIDRLSVTWSTPRLVLRLGRQAITWGGGLVFRPLDIVAPFSPTATDTAYKPGADMLYAQVLFDSGADIQAVAVPRPLTTGGPPAHDASTFALRGQATLGALDASLTLARDRGDTVAGLGLGGPLGGATWTADYALWQLAGGDRVPVALVNYADVTPLGRYSLAWFVEAWHNGFGVDSAVPLDSLPARLAKRMAAGQVFLAGTDFVALGTSVALTPELSARPAAIVSLNDHSALVSLRLDWAIDDNSNLVLDAQHPLGGRGTEFGGRETAAGSGVFATPATSLSLRLVRFF